VAHNTGWGCGIRAIDAVAVVVSLHPVPDDLSRLVESLKHLLSDALFFETPKEPFNDPVLFRRIGRDECLLQPMIPTRLSELTTLEDQAIVAPEDRGADGSQCAEPCETGRFHRPLCLLGPTPKGQFVADEFPIMTINHRREMRPAVLATGNRCHIHRPPFIAPTRPTHPALYERPWG
jgi:hypothetical protein